MQRKNKNKINTRQDGQNQIRLKGVAQDTITLTGVTATVQVSQIGLSVEAADSWIDRLIAVGPNFSEYRIRSLTAKIVPSLSTADGSVQNPTTVYAGFETDPDAIVPTTLEEVVDNNGDMGNTYQPFEVRWPSESSQWLKTTVGVTNTDARFYRSGSLFVAALLPNTFAQTIDILYRYDVEFRNPR